MAKIGGKREDMPTDVVTVGVNRLLERPDREGVAPMSSKT